MKTVEMRKILKEAGQKVPRNNVDVKEAYQNYVSRETVEGPEKVTPPVDTGKPIKLVSSNVYTYVGSGDEPPHKIKFMGQWFTRGMAEEVNPDILEKVSRHASFVKGKVDINDYYELDEKEKRAANEQRQIDRQTQMQSERLNRGNKG